MRRSRIMLLALMSGIGTLGLLELTRSAPQQPEETARSSDTVQVLVFARDLPRGTLVDETSLRWQEQLVSAIPPTAITAPMGNSALPRDLMEKLLRRDVLAGEPVSPVALVEGAAGFMSMTLEPGMRAVGITVTPQQLAGGFIQPEDHVDVIHTMNIDIDGDGSPNTVSQFVLENLRVLAVGETPSKRTTAKTAEEQAAQTVDDSGAALLGDTITLEVSDAEAPVLFSALSTGQISLALRALDDQGPSRIVPLVERLPDAETGKEAKAEPAVATAPAAPTMPKPDEPQKTTIRVIGNGATRYEEITVPTTLAAGGQP